jgi:hypothetical protein
MVLQEAGPDWQASTHARCANFDGPNPGLITYPFDPVASQEAVGDACDLVGPGRVGAW